MLQQVFAVVVIFGGGWLVEVGGAHSYFAAAAVAAFGSLLIWLSLRLKQPRRSLGIAPGRC